MSTESVVPIQAIINQLKDLSDGDMALQMESMAELLDDHPCYKDQNLPPWISGPTHLRQNLADLKHASVAAKQDESKEPERQRQREICAQTIGFTIQHVAMYSAHAKDRTFMDHIGVELRHRSYNYSREALRPPDRPTKFVVKHNTGVSGSICAYVGSWEGKGSVELQVTEGDPADEASWRTLNIFHSCRMKANDLEPAKRCNFRTRLRNDAGNGPWSEVIELITL